jgi:hypothetical protein
VVAKIENIGATAVCASELTDIKDVRAVVDWGDGVDTFGTIYLTSADTVIVSSSHRWLDSGQYDVAVTLETQTTITIDPPAIPTVHIIANDNSLAEVVNGLSLSETAGKTFTAVVGYFDFTPINNFTVYTSIDWGDGSPESKGTIKEVSPGFYSVSGTHEYAKPGNYTANVGVTATPNPKGPITEPIILLVAYFDSSIAVK